MEYKQLLKDAANSFERLDIGNNEPVMTPVTEPPSPSLAEYRQRKEVIQCPLTQAVMNGSLSAFARRQAIQARSSEVSHPAEVQVVPVVEEAGIAQPPKKKRKGVRHTKTTRVAAFPAVETSDIRDGSDDGSDIAGQITESSDIEGTFEDDPSDPIQQSSSEIPARSLSTLSSRSSILSDTDSAWTVRLHPSDNLAILGQYDLWVRSGAVSILGAIIQSSSKLHRVFAPSTHSIPFIKPIPNPFGSGNPPCEICILSCASRLRVLSQLAPKFGRIWNRRKHKRDKKRSFFNVQNSADDLYKRPLHGLEIPPDWQVILSRLLASEHNVAVMICGPKGSGKSTFCRMLVNAMLFNERRKHEETENRPEDSCVAFLDLDPGQPEFSPPGEISLHKLQTFNLGPPFTHPTSNGSDDAVKAHHYGHLSPKGDPDHYYRCTRDLFSYCQKFFVKNGTCPLIVNCSGWIQGSGLEFMTKLIDDLRFSDIIYTSTTGPDEVTDALSEAAIRAKSNLHQLTSRAPEMTTRTAADLRMMQTLSYFHQGEPEGDNLRWNALPLARVPPVVVHYAGPKQGIAAVMILGDAQHPNFLESLLEGCVVGVVAIDEDMIAEEETDPDPDLPNADMDNMDTEDDILSETDTHDISNKTYKSWSADIGLTPPQPMPIPIHRTPSGIPYLPSYHHITNPLPPSHSHSLGQALIRSINPRTKTIHLSTPIPLSTITHTIHSNHHKIVLVRGKLDTPTWAYSEQLNYEKARRRRRQKVLGEKEEDWADEVRELVERQPWASVVEGGRTGSARVRRVRRDIRYKGQRDVGSGE